MIDINFPVWRPRCEYCGRFVRYDSKHYPGYMESYDVDPPEDIFYCLVHAKEMKEINVV